MADERLYLYCTICRSATPLAKWWWDEGAKLYAHDQENFDILQDWITDHVRCEGSRLFHKAEVPHIRLCSESKVTFEVGGFCAKKDGFWKRLFRRG